MSLAHSNIKLLYVALIIGAISLAGCMGKKTRAEGIARLGGSLPDTLRIGTLYSPSSYFIYREQPMGFNYEIACKFAEEHGMGLKVEVASGIPQLMKMLLEGKIDLLAYDIPVNAEYGRNVRYCGMRSDTHLVLVQPKRKAIKDIKQLAGKTVFVEEKSKYEKRLREINKEIGGGIVIMTVGKDSLIADDMIGMVSEGKIPMTIVESDVAELNKNYYPEIDVALALSDNQQNRWAVRGGDYALAQAIDRWSESVEEVEAYRSLHKKYFEMSRASSFSSTDAVIGERGIISEYDNLFRRYAAEIGWDWRLLAAIAHTESRFDNSQISWAGAIGLMQVMPATAEFFGVAPSSLNNPSVNVATAASLLAHLEDIFESRVKNPEERLKFVLAAYNSGAGHILDAMALARKYGLDPERWYGNVCEMALRKTLPEYFNDPAVKHGYFRARETIEFVERVKRAYSIYRRAAKH